MFFGWRRPAPISSTLIRGFRQWTGRNVFIRGLQDGRISYKIDGVLKRLFFQILIDKKSLDFSKK